MRRGSEIEKYLALIARLGLVTGVASARSRFGHVFAGIDLDGKRMLDIGGGRGIYSFYAAAAGAREAVCLEPEAAGVSTGARGHFERIRSEFPGTSVTLDTRTIQEYSSGSSFDVVLLYASVNHLDEDACVHLPDDANARHVYTREFARIASLLVPGGRIVVSDCSNRNFFASLGMKSPIVPTVEWRKHQPPEVWARLLGESGFCSPEIRWEPVFGYGRAVESLTANAAAAYFLKSVFHLSMERP